MISIVKNTAPTVDIIKNKGSQTEVFKHQTVIIGKEVDVNALDERYQKIIPSIDLEALYELERG